MTRIQQEALDSLLALDDMHYVNPEYRITGLQRRVLTELTPDDAIAVITEYRAQALRRVLGGVQ